MSISQSLELEERGWREIRLACATKAARIEAGNYGDPQGEECSAWGAHLREIAAKVGGQGQGSLELEERDWREIYYACDTVAKLIEEEDALGAAYLREMITKIEGLPGIVL